MFLCWSVKGGSGTTVVAASLALVLSQQRPTVLVDLAGDAPATLGLPEPSGPGVADWLASPTADAAALLRLALPAADRLQLLPLGSALTPPAIRWSALATALIEADATIVIDAGTAAPPGALAEATSHRLLVTRPCYLALRRAVAAGTPPAASPTGIVLITEPGRALHARDVERALGVPVLAEVPLDPVVARAVDAGLLASRLPRSLATAVGSLLTPAA